MAKWLSKYEQGGLVLKQKTKDNYDLKANPNEVKASVGPGYVGLGYNTKGRNYSSAWGGQFQDGGSIDANRNLYVGGQRMYFTDAPEFQHVTGSPNLDDTSSVKQSYTPIENQNEDQVQNTSNSNGDLVTNTATNAAIPKDKKSQQFYNTLDKYYNSSERTDREKAQYAAFQRLNEAHGYATVGFRSGNTSMINPFTGRLKLGTGDGTVTPEHLMKEYIAEYSHYQQYNQNPEESGIKKTVKFLGNMTKDWGNMFKNLKGLNFGEAYQKNYHTPGTTEYEAHSINQPKLENELLNYYNQERSKRKGKLQNGDSLPEKVLLHDPKSEGDHQYSLKKTVTPAVQTGEMPIEFAMGGSLPGAVGFTYARTAGAAPSNGKYAKKTNASAQNGKVLDPNADDRATLDFNNSDPAFQYVRANSFVPFDTKDFEGIKQNIAGYMKSPLYSKRLSLSIPDQELAKDVQQQRLDNLLSIKLNPNTVDRGTDYNMFRDRVNIGASDFVDNPSIAHEVAHGIIPNITLSYGKQNLLSKAANVVGDLFQPFEQFSKSELEKINIPLSGRVTAPNASYQRAIQEEHYAPQGSRASAKTAAGETYGDLTGMRQLLLDNGITTEFGQDLTPELWEKAKKNPKIKNQPGMQRMMLKFKDEDIIKMNNEVAYNNASNRSFDQAQNGKEMSFYQQGLDFTPKNISKNGSVIKDDMGQWAHPGEITEINSNDITMEGVDYPVLGISDTGDTKLMQPGENYKFKGKKVTEFPMMENGGWLNKYTPKAQTGITTSIGSGTTNPTVQLTTQEDIKKVKKKADDDTKSAFAAAAKRDRQNQAYISKDRSTPISRAADQQMLTDAYMAEAQRNSPLAQTFASWAPGGTDVGTVQARQFSKTLPIVAGGAAGMAVLPEVLAGLAANMGGIPGLTGNNIVNALFAYEAAKNIPNVGSSISNAYENPTWGNVGDATAETVLTGLNVLPFAAEAIKGAKSLNKLRNTVNASKETPVINDMGEIINAAPIEESGSRHLYNPVTGQTLQYDASGNVISSSKKLTDAEIRAHNRNMVGTFKTGYTPPPPEGMEPYLLMDDALTPSWQQQELPGLHLSSTIEGGPISKIIEPKTGLINVEQALGIIGKESGGASKVGLIKQALGDELPKKMDYNEFRKVVQDQLIPLERNFTMQRSNFGIDNLGFNKKVGMLGNTTREAAGAEIERIKEIIRTEEGVLGEEERVQQLKKILDRDIKDYNNLPLENQTLLLSNKEKFGRGSDAHNNPEETLGHIHFLRDAETPDVLTMTQMQSDAFQGTHRAMPNSLENAEFSLYRLEGIINDRNKLLESLKAEKKLAKDEASNVLATKENLHKLDEQINRYTKLIEEQEAVNKLSRAEVENYTQKSLLDKKHQERYLQEFVDYAGKRGDVSKIRVPTSETAAKVQNYKSVDPEKFVAMYKEALAKDPAAFAEKMNNLPESERKFIQSILDGKIKGSVFDPEAQTILKKYTEQPKLIKKLFGVEPKTVTDGKGNTWYEFDIPSKFKGGKGEIKAFKNGGWLNKYK